MSKHDTPETHAAYVTGWNQAVDAMRDRLDNMGGVRVPDMTEDEQGRAEKYAEERGQYEFDFTAPFSHYKVEMEHNLTVRQVVDIVAKGFPDAQSRAAALWREYPVNMRQRKGMDVFKPEPVRFRVKKISP